MVVQEPVWCTLSSCLAVGWLGQLIFLLSLTGQCKCSGNRINGSLFQPGQHTNTRINLSCFSRHSAFRHRQQQTRKGCLHSSGFPRALMQNTKRSTHYSFLWTPPAVKRGPPPVMRKWLSHLWMFLFPPLGNFSPIYRSGSGSCNFFSIRGRSFAWGDFFSDMWWWELSQWPWLNLRSRPSPATVTHLFFM